MKNKTNLIVGATGGIGRAVAKSLSDRNENIRVIARNKEKAEKYFKEFKNVEILIGDATDKTFVRNAAKDAKTLFYCLNLPYNQWELNAVNLLKISLDAAADEKVKFVFPGNVYVYGHAKYNPVDEKHPHNAHTKKGKIRIEMENLVKKASVEKGLVYTIIRMPDFYGPFVVNGYSEKMFIRAAANNAIYIIGDAGIAYEFIFIGDGANALVNAGLSEKGNNKEFNVPGYSQITQREFANKIITISSSSGKIKFVNSDILFSIAGLAVPVVKELKEMLYLKREKLILDGALYRNTFGELPATPYDEGIKQTLDWANTLK